MYDPTLASKDNREYAGTLNTDVDGLQAQQTSKASLLDYQHDHYGQSEQFSHLHAPPYAPFPLQATPQSSSFSMENAVGNSVPTHMDHLTPVSYGNYPSNQYPPVANIPNGFSTTPETPMMTPPMNFSRSSQQGPQKMFSRYKTKLCSFYMESKGSFCPHGPSCQFAHDFSDLRLPGRNGLPSFPAPPRVIHELQMRANAAQAAGVPLDLNPLVSLGPIQGVPYELPVPPTLSTPLPQSQSGYVPPHPNSSMVPTSIISDGHSQTQNTGYAGYTPPQPHNRHNNNHQGGYFSSQSAQNGAHVHQYAAPNSFGPSQQSVQGHLPLNRISHVSHHLPQQHHMMNGQPPYPQGSIHMNNNAPPVPSSHSSGMGHSAMVQTHQSMAMHQQHMISQQQQLGHHPSLMMDQHPMNPTNMNMMSTPSGLTLPLPHRPHAQSTDPDNVLSGLSSPVSSPHMLMNQQDVDQESSSMGQMNSSGLNLPSVVHQNGNMHMGGSMQMPNFGLSLNDVGSANQSNIILNSNHINNNNNSNSNNNIGHDVLAASNGVDMISSLNLDGNDGLNSKQSWDLISDNLGVNKNILRNEDEFNIDPSPAK